MRVYYEGIGKLTISVPAGSGLAVGQVCKLGTDGKAAPGAAGDKILGVVESLRDGLAGVIVRGAVTVSLSGTAPQPGYAALAADGQGGLKTASGGRETMVLAVGNQRATVLL